MIGHRVISYFSRNIGFTKRTSLIKHSLSSTLSYFFKLILSHLPSLTLQRSILTASFSFYSWFVFFSFLFAAIKLSRSTLFFQQSAAKIDPFWKWGKSPWSVSSLPGRLSRWQLIALSDDEITRSNCNWYTYLKMYKDGISIEARTVAMTCWIELQITDLTSKRNEEILPASDNNKKLFHDSDLNCLFYIDVAPAEKQRTHFWSCEFRVP